MKKIVCFHLLNDYSGSPRVLEMILGELLDNAYSVDLITSLKCGALSNLSCYPKFRMFNNYYHFSRFKIITILRYTFTQLYTFFFAFRYCFKKDIVFYINTILPVGPALAAKIMCKKIIYHYHENAKSKGKIYQFLCKCMQLLADDIICVSAYQSLFLKRVDNVHVVPNAIPYVFLSDVEPDPKNSFAYQNVLMLSSLKEYKGLNEFVLLAQRMPKYKFTLVVNAFYDEIKHYINAKKLVIPANLSLYEKQQNVVTFYKTASIVLNLSNTDKFIETFGMTALEAMSAGLPVIIPKEGGIAEMIDEGINGFHIGVQDIDMIQSTIDKLLSDEKKYTFMSKQAYNKSLKYLPQQMMNSIINIIEKQNL